jgi:hypothetical protein
MNSTLNSTKVSSSGINKEVIINIGFVIAIAGLITNLLCIIVFSMINKTFKTNGQMYKYLLMKAICDLFIFIFYTTYLLYKQCSNELDSDCGIVLQFCYIYLYHFLLLIIELYSVYFEVLGTIDCYLSIENKHKKLLTKRVFKLNSTFIIVSFSIFYFGKLFVYKIGYNHDTGEYYNEKTPLYYSTFYKTLSIIHSFLRDILGCFLCFFFNILIFLRIKKMSEKKKYLKNSLSIIKSIEAQENKVKMIYISTLNQILLHLPNFIYGCYGKYFKSTFWSDYSQVSFLIMVLSYATPFPIYVLFNRIFRHYFFKLIRIKYRY